MLEVVSDGLWTKIKKLAKGAKYRYAAVAYVTSDTHVQFGDGDILIVDASDGAVGSGQTDAKVLLAAQQRGAELYSLDGLHAKAFVLGPVAVIGSGNLSSSSAERLVEAAILTDHPNAVSGAVDFIDQLKKQADPIDNDFLTRILKIPVKKPPYRAPKKKYKVPIRKHRTWLVNVVPIEEDKYPDEDKLAEQGLAAAEAQLQEKKSSVSWLRFTGKSRFKREAKAGDRILEIWQSTPTTRKALVYYPSQILRRQDETTHRVRFYQEDPEEKEERRLTWTEFKELWGKVTGDEVPKKDSVRLLKGEIVEKLSTLWKKA